MPPYFLYPPRSSPSPQKIQQQTWLDNALCNGPLPTHKHRPRGPCFDIKDRDPSAADLGTYQQQLADANSKGELLTFHHGQLGWHAHPYPRHSARGIKRKPSGFRDLPDAQLPLCPHSANSLRTEEECRMRPHSHRHKAIGLVYYLQVPTDMHPCSFIAVLKDQPSGPIKDEPKEEEHELKEKPSTPTPLGRIQDQGRPSHKREIKREATLVKAEVLGHPLRAMGPTRRTSSNRKISGTRLKRENALGEIPSSSSSPVAGASSSPIIIDDDVPSHFNSSPTPPPIPTAMGHPKPQRLNGGPRRSLVALTYTAAEAEANLHGDPDLREVIRTRTTEVLASRDFSRHLWLQEGTDGFPARLLAYSVGSPLAARITQAAVLGATPVGRFISTLCNTNGALGLSFDHLLNFLRACHGCGNHFTAAAFNAHLEKDGNAFRCGNHPTRSIVAPVDTSAPYDDVLRPRTFRLGRAPGQDQPAHYTDFTFTTGLGIALCSLNTRFGLPDDIWEAARSALISCIDCGCIRTVHAHLDHLQGGYCADLDVSAGDRFFVALGANEFAAIGPNNERTILTLDD
ncbi:hypothetical protein B0H14DRAFT_3426909 [Mycena olivaceomarginata]|nr:hypothetical protein B0H14DRAFT_3426909 [Mycena olivaceomarginata]